MSESLVIRLEDDPEHASWLILSEQGHRLSRSMRGPLAAAAPEARERKVILLVPGIHAVTARVRLPVKRQSRIEQMLPFQLEDAVAEDVDTLLFAAGPRRDDGTIPVAVVARELVGKWLASCADAGITVDAVFPDLQGVPETPSNLTLLLEKERIYGRLPEGEPFVFEDLSLTELMDVLEAETDASPHLKNVVVYADDSGQESFASELDSLRETASSVDVTLLPDGALPRLAATLIAEPGSNLLQGPYRVKSNWYQLLRPWRTPAALAVGLAVIATLVQAGRYYSLASEDQILTEQLLGNCSAAFGATGLGACDAEIRSRLALAGEGGEVATERTFLETLAAVASLRDQRMQFQAVSFRDGVTNLRFTAPDVQALDNLAQALAAGGRFEANIQSAVPSDQGVEGRLQIAELRR
ncbi:MAG TPA: type II secretion system protein GspL [Gammaproteobacteria bacterium]|nr:type II secretion system protein GspL [Gammaproteobacteria bacterium]